MFISDNMSSTIFLLASLGIAVLAQGDSMIGYPRFMSEALAKRECCPGQFDSDDVFHAKCSGIFSEKHMCFDLIDASLATPCCGKQRIHRICEINFRM